MWLFVACVEVLLLLMLLIFTTFAPQFREEGALKLPLFCYKLGNGARAAVVLAIK